MLFLPHQEPPPKPPAVVQAVQKSQDAAATHGSLVGPPKTLMNNATTDFKKTAAHPDVETAAIDGNAVPVNEGLAANQLKLFDASLVWGRYDRMDWKSVSIIPFWTEDLFGLGHNTRGGPIGRSVEYVPFPFPLVRGNDPAHLPLLRRY
jgi:hypothetical protein